MQHVLPRCRPKYGPLADVFREVKRIFDPENILNPGKIVSDDAELLTSSLRHLGTVPIVPEPSTNGSEPAAAASVPAWPPPTMITSAFMKSPCVSRGTLATTFHVKLLAWVNHPFHVKHLASRPF